MLKRHFDAARALENFQLMDAFERRPEDERHDCLRWLEAAASAETRRDRIAWLLDCLAFGNVLPGLDQTPEAGP
jgi:hypothetical protein